MKRLIFTAAVLASLFMFGCWPENSVAPNYQTESTNSAWLELPNSASSLSMNKTVSTTQLIDGALGGKISVNEKFDQVKIKANLDFPKNSFEGTKTIFATFDNLTLSASFFPSPLEFENPVLLDLEYTGVDLSSISPEQIDFSYIGLDGNLVKAEYDKLTIDVKKGVVKVKNAKIYHFSRYGFTKREVDDRS